MDIIIKETSASESFSIIDPKTGVNWISDFVGNTGATMDGQFVWDDELDAYVCDQETYDWWENCIDEHQKLADRVYELEQEHGWDAVHKVIDDEYYCDLGDQPRHVNSVLDEAFGQEE